MHRLKPGANTIQARRIVTECRKSNPLAANHLDTAIKAYRRHDTQAVADAIYAAAAEETKLNDGPFSTQLHDMLLENVD